MRRTRTNHKPNEPQGEAIHSTIQRLAFSSCMISSTVCAVSLFTSAAEALPLPDSSTCSSTGQACLTIGNTTNETTAIDGWALGSFGIGVQGSTDFGYGVYGRATGSGGTAVYGSSQDNGSIGVYGISDVGDGMYATSTSGIGILAYSGTGNAVVAQNNLTNRNSAALSAFGANSSSLAIMRAAAS